MFCQKKTFLKTPQNSQENTCATITFWLKLQAWGIKKTLAQVFSCEFCEIFKNSFFNRTALVATSKRLERRPWKPTWLGFTKPLNQLENFDFSTNLMFERYWPQKQPPRGVLKKRCSGNMQQIYRRTFMLKCDFNKVPLQVYWNHTSAWVWCSPVNLLHIFRTSFLKNTSELLLLWPLPYYPKWSSWFLVFSSL